MTRGASIGDRLELEGARELDDALDALEHAVDAPGFAGANAELVKLRDELEKVASRRTTAIASGRASEEGEVANALRMHVGIAMDFESLDVALSAAAKRLRERVTRVMGEAGLSPDRVAARAATMVMRAQPASAAGQSGSAVSSK